MEVVCLMFDSVKVARVWVVGVVLVLAVSFFVLPASFAAHYLFLLWGITLVAGLYRASRFEPHPLSRGLKVLYYSLGVLGILLGLFSISMGIGRPPFSLDDISYLLAGVSLIVFTYVGATHLVSCAVFPMLVVLGYQLFGRTTSEWSEPLVGPTVRIMYFISRAAGFNPSVRDNVISFFSRGGHKMNLAIVGDCTGVWSLAAYGVSVIAIFLLVSNLSRDRLKLILLGFAGTYVVNIIRVTILFFTAYVYGYGGATKIMHIHVGWVGFSIWMLIFWYVFFRKSRVSASGSS